MSPFADLHFSSLQDLADEQQPKSGISSLRNEPTQLVAFCSVFRCIGLRVVEDETTSELLFPSLSLQDWADEEIRKDCSSDTALLLQVVES